MALENNLEIDIERTNRSTAETNVQAARGFFDPTFPMDAIVADHQHADRFASCKAAAAN